MSDEYSNTTTPEDVWESTHGKIIFSAVVFRHGDRYPLANFSANFDEAIRPGDRCSFGDPPASSNSSDEWTPAKKGQLTKKGKNRAYQLGRWLRERYRALIDDQPYNSLVLNMLSSHTDRTVMTGQLLLAGLYPPVHENEVWNKDVPWQPIPVYSLPESERMIGGGESCPRYNVEMEHVKDSPELFGFYLTHQETLDYIKENSKSSVPRHGIDSKIGSILLAAGVCDNVETSKELGWKLPEWTEKIDNETLRIEILAMALKLRTFNHEMKRLKGGPLLGHIVEELKSKRDNAQSKKLFQFYSGHDINIVTLLNMLGLWKGDHRPGYCSTILFELRKLKEDYIVTVGYKDKDAPLKLMKIPETPELCTLDNFIEVTKDLIPEDWDTESRSFAPDYNFII